MAAVPFQQPNAYAPKPPQAPAQPAAPQINPYEEFRKQAAQRNQAQMQTQQNALQRRFAQMGGGPSGAQVKMEQDVMRQGADDLHNQISGINAQEAQAAQQQNQFNQQFGLEQLKSLQGLDLARRAQAQDEMGQIFNQTLAGMQSGHAQSLLRDQMDNFFNYISDRGANSGYGSRAGNLYEAYMRRLMAPQQEQVG